MFAAAVMAVMLLAGASCNGNGNGKRPEPVVPEEGTGNRADYLVPDRGHWALVNKFLDACAGGDAAAAEACLSPWAVSEIGIQYRGDGDLEKRSAMRSYVGAAAATLKSFPGRDRPEGIDRPYRRPEDSSGDFLEVVLIRKNPAALKFLAFYMVDDPAAGGLVIDNILTRDPLEAPSSAPAINPSMPTPAHAWVVYYDAVFMGRHPFHTPLASDPLLPLSVRLAYLRAVCSPAFMNNIVTMPEFGGNVGGFIAYGEKQFREVYGNPIVNGGQKPGEFYVTLPARKSNDVALYHLMVAVRQHGQWRLHHQEEVDYVPGSAGG